MYYRELLTKHISLVQEYRMLKNNPNTTTEQLNKVANKIITINNKLSTGLIAFSNHPDREAIKEYKKSFKHEFLRQALQ